MELMIAMGLAGVLSLAVMTVMTEATRSSEQVKRQLEANRNLELFVYALEQYLGQTTQVVDCHCTSAVNGCRNTLFDTADAAAEAPTLDTTPVNAIEFVYENASDPKVFPSAGCIFSGNNNAPIAGSTIVPVGCKRKMALRYTKPTTTNGATASKPGALELIWTDPTNAATAAGTTVAKLDNVTFFSCGMSEASGTHLSNSDFRLRIDIKSKLNNVSDPLNPQYETWSPSDAAAYRFSNGYRRSFITQIYFRNLATPGLHFGKLRQHKNCIKTGSAATSLEDCCSGYRDPSNNKCIDSSNCIIGGLGAPGGVKESCCSRMIDVQGKCV